MLKSIITVAVLVFITSDTVISTVQPETYVRTGPGIFYQLDAILPSGTSITTLNENKRWIKVKYGQDQTGFVSARSLQPRGEKTSLASLFKGKSISKTASRSVLTASIKGFVGTYGGNLSPSNQTLMSLYEYALEEEKANAFFDTFDDFDKDDDWLDQIMDQHESDLLTTDNHSHSSAVSMAMVSKLAMTHPPINDPVIYPYLNCMVNQLLTETPFYDFKVTPVMIDNESPVAYSIPGGTLCISTAMIKACQTEANLAGVIAHEIAHLVYGHGLEELAARKAKITAQSAFEELDDEIGTTDIEDELNEMMDDLYTRVINYRSLNAELAADEMAMAMLRAAGYDYSNYPALIAKAGLDTQGLDKSNIEQRIEQATQYVKKWPVGNRATFMNRYQAYFGN